MTRSPFSSRQVNSSGFSLIEVAIAVGILAVALVALLGLMPGGMSNFRKAMDTSITAQIAQRVMNDLEQAEFNQVIDSANLPPDPTGKSYCKANFSFRWPKVTPGGNDPTLRFFDDQGAELVPPTGRTTLSTEQQKSAVYTVNIRILPRAAVPTKNNFGSAVAQATVQVARNPSGSDIPIVTAAADDGNTPDRNLFKKTSGVQIYTYYALFGNNQGK
jgi:prepilin-type N-terminal cleavage/methylation domain-containing protein